MKNQRVETLDYLRGIMAVAVLIYHYSSWSNISYDYPFNDFIDRLGIYAVGAFYVLSGATLAIVYLKREVNKQFLKEFMLKRFLRIVPLLYLATTLTILVSLYAAFAYNSVFELPSLWKLFVNYSLLFGWIDHDSYIATGVWSIGNELVFYSIFPIMLFLVRKSIRQYIAFFVITVVITLWYSYAILDVSLTLAEQWSTYINPLNQIYLFAGGFLIGWLYKFRNLKVNQKLLFALSVISVVTFLFLPIPGEGQINYITGYAKIILSLSIFAMCFSAMFIEQKRTNKATNILKYVGDRSYSIYLLHPVAYHICKITLSLYGINNTYLTILAAIVGTFIMATLSYKYIEKPFVNSWKKINIKNEIEIKKQRTS